MSQLLKNLMTLTLHVLLLASIALPASAGVGVRFRQISLDEGLSQSTVYCIFQDRLGFLWFGTYDGLNRYDGYSFKTYKFRPDEPGSISNNRILAIFEDQAGDLWVGTDGGGLNKLDRNKDTFTHYQNNPENANSLSHNRVRALAEDGKGNLWVGTGGGGLNRLNPETGDFRIYRRGSSAQGSLSHNRVRVLLMDSKGRLWVGTGGGGLNLYQEDTDNFINYKHNPADPSSLSDNEINAIIETKDGSLWIGTYSGGLNRFDPSTGKAVNFSHGPNDLYSLTSNKVHSLLEDDLGQVWIATDNGLDRFSGLSQTFVHYRHDIADPTSLSDDTLHSLFMDRSGVFWVGTRNGGVNKFERGKQNFDLFQSEPGDPESLADNRVNAMYQDLLGRLWVGTGGSGLSSYDPTTDTFLNIRNVPNDPTSLGDNRILAMEVDKTNHLWVGTRAGASRTPLDKPGKFQVFRNKPNRPGSLANDVVWSLLADDEGRLWLGTEGGLDRLEADGSTFSHHRHEPARADSLPDNVVWRVFEDSEQTIWVGTENGGLSQMIGENSFRSFRHDPTRPESLSNNTVLSICEENKRLWVGTWGGGLNGYLGDDRFEHFSERDGLPNDVIYGILGDGHGNLWLSTNRGLSQFNPDSGASRNYATNDGLQGMEFNPGSSFRGLKGEMFFGGNNGFNAFHPDNFRENNHVPEMLITAFRQHEEVVASHIRERGSFELNYRENYLSFEFVAFDYNDPERNRYAYILEGEDQNWIKGTHRFARYNNLEPGHYTFRVKGANNDNIWNDAGVAVKVHIVPPFYRTTWFYVLGVLGIFASFMGIIFFQRHLLKQEEVKALVALELTGKTLELEEARRLQLSMLPKSLPQLAHLELAVLMQTATEVGGDYYDFHLSSDGVLTAAVGDATGHGLRAGTLVSAAKGLFLSLVPTTSLVGLLTQASSVLRQMGFKRMFMAMNLVRFNGRSMSIAVAGMPPTYIYRTASNQVETIAIKGMPLGAFPFPYKEETYELFPGDVILLNSDGLEEIFNNDNRMLGGARIQKAFAKCAHKPPKQINDDLLALGLNWAGSKPQADDITLVIIKVK